MNTQYVSPKLLLEFYKGQKIPPLAVKYEVPHHFTEVINQQRKNQYNHFTHSSRDKNASEPNDEVGESLNDIQNELQKEIEQNRELRLIIKELEQKIERLKQVNDQLIVRVEELQKRNISLGENSESIKRDINRKVRIQTYKQIQDFLRLSVEKFTQTMTLEKITPQCENKIQLFLQQILNINNLSVRKSLNSTSELKKRFDEKEADRTINQIVLRHSAQKSKERKKQIEKVKYEALLEKLSWTSGEMIKPGTIVTRRINSPSKGNSQVKSKRPKIFSKTKEKVSGEKQHSQEHRKRLDF